MERPPNSPLEKCRLRRRRTDQTQCIGLKLKDVSAQPVSLMNDS